jgi:hypothetical protein
MTYSDQTRSNGAILSLKFTFGLVYFLLLCTVAIAVCSAFMVFADPSWRIVLVLVVDMICATLLSILARKLVLTIRWLSRMPDSRMPDGYR